MSSVRIDKACDGDVPAITRLLADAAPDCVPQSSDRVRRNLARYRIARGPSGQVLGCASLEALDSQRVELRALAVAPDLRGAGLGARLVEQVVHEARRLDSRVVCVTRRPRFFQRQGFTEVPLWTVPSKPGVENLPGYTLRTAMVHVDQAAA